MKLATMTVLILILTNTADAQPTEVRRTFSMPGTFELGGSGSFSSVLPVSDGATGRASYSIGIFPTAGYFVAEGVELMVDPLAVTYSWSQDRKELTMMPMAGAAYNFRAHPRAFPYVEGLAGFAYSRVQAPVVTRTGFTWAARVGVKALMTSTAIVNVGIQYQQVTLNLSSETKRNGYDQIALTVGISVWL